MRIAALTFLILAGEPNTNQLTKYMENLESSEASSQLPLIDRYGCTAVKQLAENLKILPSGHYSPSHQTGRLQRQVYTIAALRYITGKDFYGRKSKTQLRIYDEAGKDFLTDTAPKGRTKYFGIWMSRGSIYLAPRGAQAQVIAAWKAYARSGACQHSAWLGRTSPNFYLSGIRSNP